MNYWDGTDYVSSDPRFDLGADAFVANRVQHPVTIGANINQVGAVKLVTPDGKRLNSTPVAIGLFDAQSGRSVIIATITNSAGVLVDENRIVFQNAFAGVCADIVYILERGSFEQDVVFTGRIDPGDFGFPTNTTRVQIFTEFYDVPRPDRERRPVYVEKDASVRRRMASPDRIDEAIGFGEFVIGTGEAYSGGTAGNPAGASAVVTKEMAVSEGRTFLIESVQFKEIASAMKELPVCEEGQASIGKKSSLKMAEIPRPGRGKEAVQIIPRRGGKEVAQLGDRSRGVTVDYRGHIGGTMTGTTVFQGDYTYLVTDIVYCNGPVIIEGGVVFKYKVGKSIWVQNSSLTCQTTDYRPAVFTAMDDDTIGESAAGYTGATTGYTGVIASGGYANPALLLKYTGTLSNCRFRYAQFAIQLYQDDVTSTSVTVKHSQFVDCVRGIYISGLAAGCAIANVSVTVQNDLFARVRYPFSDYLTGSFFYLQLALNATECTFDRSTFFFKVDNSVPVFGGVTATGSLFSYVTNQTSGASISFGGSFNGFYKSFVNQTFGTSPVTIQTYPFQTAGAGDYYLAPNSVCSGAGPTSVTPASLLSDLKKRTTSPPNTNKVVQFVSSSETWPVWVQRDTDRLDIGYHYPALDYLASFVIVGAATLTLDPGVAVATFGYTGIRLEDGSVLNTHGDALMHNQLCAFLAVQENAIIMSSTAPSNMMVLYATVEAGSGLIDAKFTDFSGMSGLGYVAYGYSLQLQLRDCYLGSANINLYMPGAPESFSNNLFERSNLTLGPSYFMSPIDFYNNTVRNSALSFDDGTSGGTDGYRTVRDNLFDSSSIWVPYPAYVAHDHNAYYNCSSSLIPNSGNGDKTLTAAPVYAAGPLGSSYISSTSPSIVNAGSRLASDAGLYHHTISPPGTTKEGTSQVDMGFHYVAVDGTGRPIDTDLDGVADYAEDLNGNGNGADDPTSWQVYNSPNGLVTGNGLVVYTPLK
jgi:hypothetical protein